MTVWKDGQNNNKNFKNMYGVDFQQFLFLLERLFVFFPQWACKKLIEFNYRENRVELLLIFVIFVCSLSLFISLKVWLKLFEIDYAFDVLFEKIENGDHYDESSSSVDSLSSLSDLSSDDEPERKDEPKEKDDDAPEKTDDEEDIERKKRDNDEFEKKVSEYEAEHKALCLFLVDTPDKPVFSEISIASVEHFIEERFDEADTLHVIIDTKGELDLEDESSRNLFKRLGNVFVDWIKKKSNGTIRFLVVGDCEECAYVLVKSFCALSSVIDLSSTFLNTKNETNIPELEFYDSVEITDIYWSYIKLFDNW